MSGVVTTQLSDRILTITLNRPQALNAVSAELAENLKAAIRAADEDSQIDGMVLTGAGDKSFCAGVDLLEARDMTAERIESWFGAVCEIYRTILLTDKPFICAMNGIAAGGGNRRNA